MRERFSRNLVSKLHGLNQLPPRSAKSQVGQIAKISPKNRFFEVYSAATAPLPTILHQVAVPTCATSLQKMKTIGPLVIELASLEIRGSSQLPSIVHTSSNTLKGDRNRPKSRNRLWFRAQTELERVVVFFRCTTDAPDDCGRFRNRSAPPELIILVFVKIPTLILSNLSGLPP